MLKLRRQLGRKKVKNSQFRLQLMLKDQKRNGSEGPCPTSGGNRLVWSVLREAPDQTGPTMGRKKRVMSSVAAAQSWAVGRL